MRAFRLLWFGATTSAVGNGMWFTAVPLLAASLTRDPKLVSLLETAAALPWLILGLLAGVAADRWNRRSLAWAGDLVRLLLVAALAVLVARHAVTMPILLAIVFALAAVATVANSAFNALLPDLVRREDLHRANGRLAAGTTAGGSFVGPSVGAVLFGSLAWLPFAVDAVSFLVSAACVRGLPRTSGVITGGGSVRQDLWEGLAWLARQRHLRGVTLGTVLLSAATGSVLGVFVLFVLQDLRLPNAAYGLLMALCGVGSIAGSFASAPLGKRLGLARTTHLAAFLGAVTFFGLAVTRLWPVAAVSSLVLGVATALWGIATTTLCQTLTPRPLLGRVGSAFTMLTYTAATLGAPAGGLAAAEWGPPAAIHLGALLALVATALLGVWRVPDVPTAPAPEMAGHPDR